MPHTSSHSIRAHMAHHHCVNTLTLLLLAHSLPTLGAALVPASSSGATIIDASASGPVGLQQQQPRGSTSTRKGARGVRALANAWLRGTRTHSAAPCLPPAAALRSRLDVGRRVLVVRLGSDAAAHEAQRDQAWDEVVLKRLAEVLGAARRARACVCRRACM